MHYKKLSATLILFCLYVFVSGQNANIIPQSKKAEMGKGFFNINENPQIVYNHEQLKFPAEYTVARAKSLKNMEPAAVSQVETLINADPYQGIHESYNWILKEGFRGMYVFNDQKNEKNLIQIFKDNRINTLIVHLSGNGAKDDQYDSDCDSWIKIKKETGLKVFWSIPFASDEKYSNTEFGEYISEANQRINAPCPISINYWKKVFGDRAKLAAKKGFDGCLVDVEMYLADVTRYSGPCYCDEFNWKPFCKDIIGIKYAAIPYNKRKSLLVSLKKEKGYIDFQKQKLITILDSIRYEVNEINPDFKLGYVLYHEEIPGLTEGLGTPEKPALILDEYTYDGSDERTFHYLASIKEYENMEGMLISGYSPGLLSPLGIILAAEKINRIDYQEVRNMGFWIWCSRMYAPDAPQGYDGLPNWSYKEYLSGLNKIPSTSD